MYANCFDENGNPKYLKMVFQMLTSPKYLTNLSIILFIVAYILKNNFLIYSILPLLITNGIFILYYCIANFKEYDRDLIYKICGENNKNKEAILTEINNFPMSLFHLSNLIIHFWPLALILYKAKTKSNLVENIQHSNFLGSLLTTMFILGVWVLSSKKNVYILIGMDESKFEYYIPRYLLLHIIVTYIYFNLF